MVSTSHLGNHLIAFILIICHLDDIGYIQGGRTIDSLFIIYYHYIII